MKKKYIAIISSALILAFICGLSVLHKSDNTSPSAVPENSTENSKIKEQNKTKEKNLNRNSNGIEKQSSVKVASVEKTDNSVQTCDLGSADSSIPLSTITVLSNLSDTIKDKVKSIADTKNIFLVQKNDNKLLVVTDNPDNIRHGVEFTEINITNGHQVKTTLGYSDKMHDSDNDKWEYDENTNMPVRHLKYNKDGDVEFIEEWNYDKSEPIKYEMKDSEGKVISIRKETLDDDSNLRVEHLIYDKQGNTKVNVSVAYNGNDVKRFTYYNADKPSVGGAVYSEYSEEGYKTRETLYDSRLKVINSFTANYKDGERENIIIYDDKNNEIEVFKSKGSN